MSEVRAQSFANHRNFPRNFLLVAAILAIDVINRAWYLIQAPSLSAAWSVLVGMALVLLCFVCRRMALTVQDRVIRLEMRQRLERVLSADKRAAIQNLSLGQLVALRFASDAELPGLVDAVLAEKITKQDEIKTRIQDWQADWLRV
jgi:hypothetical protein